jgi:hypothetical protein
MQMPQFITKFRRDRWRDQVITVGRRIDVLHGKRAGLISDEATDPAVIDWIIEIDSEIDRNERRHRALLTKIKETA